MSTLLFPCDEIGPYAYDPNVQVLWTEEIDDPCAPTALEVLSALTLNDFDLTDIVGWEVVAAILTVPPWGEFATQRTGSRGVDRAELVFASERVGNDIRISLSRFDRGFILILPSGPFLDIPDAPFNVYPVEVANIYQHQRLGEGGSQLTVQFTIRDVVCQHVKVVPET